MAGDGASSVGGESTISSTSGASSRQGPRKGDGTLDAFLRAPSACSSGSSSGSSGGAATTTTTSSSGGGSDGETIVVDGEKDDDMDKPVAPNCLSKRKIAEYNAKDRQRVPGGCKEVVDGGGKFAELQPYGSLVVAKDTEKKGKKRTHDGAVAAGGAGETTAYFFRCNVTYKCNDNVKKYKLGETYESMQNSNAWRHLAKHKLYSSRGDARVQNKATFQELVVVASGSHLRQEDPHRYFSLQMTDTLHIGKLAPFAWANDGKWRVLIKGLQQHAVEAAREGGPTFNVEAFHDQSIRVRIGWGVCLRLLFGLKAYL